ncbi:MAG TPA: hypothetical protein VFH59_08335 [Frateuria sp.]|uniref:hypothetical protein n=1 Tax=Frateuria sp. TaxID=2211372 RepID=UPI002D811041|nr:hypothetical protein [Frateuria sp.]HET6805430.1 hypothetical protein [Frateuria sp.]
MPAPDTLAAIELMAQFARRTGLAADMAPVRYLWTDAFAVGNFLGLARDGAGPGFDALAQRLIHQVHAVLGHFRADDSRRGWLAGRCGQASDDHPTRAGLRIGKPLPERRPDEPVDERLEWERDGQYFHYLTRWMQALDLAARCRREPQASRWACELADTAHRAFTHAAVHGHRRLYWKMSTDLSRPLVASMGQHDALDGLVTTLVLRATAASLQAPAPPLNEAVADYTAMLEASPLATGDPLGLGGLLMDALRLERLVRAGAEHCRALLGHILESAAASLPHCQLPLYAPADARLGFRELGLAIGLAAIERLATDDRRLRPAVDALRAQVPLRAAINRFWLEPANRAAFSWTAHRDINEVMLATSLAPDGWLSSQASADPL